MPNRFNIGNLREGLGRQRSREPVRVLSLKPGPMDMALLGKEKGFLGTVPSPQVYPLDVTGVVVLFEGLKLAA